jgi:hypothetical protein
MTKQLGDLPEGAGAPGVEINAAMIAVGEAVLDRAFESADLPPSWTVMAALGDIEGRLWPLLVV